MPSLLSPRLTASFKGKAMAKRGRKPFSIKRKNRYEGDKVLIVCEGTDTEPNYFNALKEYLKLNPMSIIVHPAKGRYSPQVLVDFAIAKIEEACAKGDPYAKAYCVIDRDNHPTYEEAFEKAKVYQHNDKCPTVLCLTPSVPCFEYWILMHEKYTNRPFGSSGSKPCDELIDTELPGYSKTDRLALKQLIEAKLEMAKKYSRRSHEEHKTLRTDSYTTVYLLVEELEYLKEHTIFDDAHKGCPDA